MTNELRPWPLVREGDRGQAVRDVQHLLRENRYELAVDGVFGPLTDGAVRDFQKDRSLVVDGIVGPNTWAAIIVQVAQGSRGDAVRAVQEELAIRVEAGNPDLEVEVDGIFGPQTDAAVRMFQEGVARAVPAFPVDGIVAPLTWQALTGGMLAD
ncbi:peptidoglycan-binding domain-containing protein [Micromonospora sp. CPCC 206061]|uniref:peptidoglycan-binding domain-containing protein n=1 Tax=Micromonospora sp. CPCC 206061 TaxID=3122410 RepID=UPI002FF1E5C8